MAASCCSDFLVLEKIFELLLRKYAHDLWLPLPARRESTYDFLRETPFRTSLHFTSPLDQLNTVLASISLCHFLN